MSKGGRRERKEERRQVGGEGGKAERQRPVMMVPGYSFSLHKQTIFYLEREGDVTGSLLTFTLC